MDAHVKKQAAELAHELAGQATTLDELNGVMRTLMKSALERMLNTELEVHLGRGAAEAATAPPRRNRQNGASPNTVQGELGKLPLEIPSDRNGSFQPQLLPKHQRRLAGFDEKILALYANTAMFELPAPIRNWKEALNHFAILFEGRLPRDLA